MVGRYVQKITEGQIFDLDDPKYGKTWIVHPVLVKISTDKLRLNFESEDYMWISPDESAKLKLVPGFRQVLRTFFKRADYDSYSREGRQIA